MTTPDYLKPKDTRQHALLERPLAWARSRRVRRYCRGKRVLDFGSGSELVNARALKTVAASIACIDQLFFGQRPWEPVPGIVCFGSYDDLPRQGFDVITSLAVFEHIEEAELPEVLRHLRSSLEPERGLLCGTVPTPRSRPVLEFLSYRLGLIDETQIRDHRVYYDEKRLADVFRRGGFEIVRYETFQLGMNSFFVARPA